MKKDNKAKKPKVKMPMSRGKKAALIILGILLLALAIYVAQYLIRYTFYNGYRKYVSSYEVEQATPYTKLNDSDCKVEGFDLVAENEFLKLYTQPSTGFVAIYDKRDGKITTSNPLNADEDTVANETNKSRMKSAFILGYYNSSFVTGDFDSWSQSVQKKGLSVESLKNGVRYTYEIGEINKKTSESAIYFSIPLEYRLVGDAVEVSIPTRLIKEEGAGYVYRIQLLQYFGAPGMGEEGYFVVPNASGSLINFNNGKLDSTNFTQYYYGQDPLTANLTTIENVDTCRLALYGICREDSSILTTIERGASLAMLTAGISGKYTERNYIYNTFILRNTDNLKNFQGGTKDIIVMEDDFYDVNVNVRYTLLTKENKGYVGLANYYRDRLIKEGVLTKLATNGDIPFYYDILGGVKETAHFMGTQYNSVHAMTTFDQAAKIVEELKAAGVQNQVMNYEGWFNGGYYHDTANRIHVTWKLGGKSDLAKLNKAVEEANGRLSLDVQLLKLSRDSNFNGTMEASRYYGAGYTATFGLVNPTTLRNTTGLGYKGNLYDVVSPKYLTKYVDKFSTKIQKIESDSITLRDLGSYLCPDKKRTNIIDREATMDVILHELEVLKGTNRKLIMNECNDYAFGYASDILNVPMYGNDYFLVDENIPLYQMIIHGSINYSSILLNYNDLEDYRPMILKLIETGTAPHYVFTWKESSEIKDTALSFYYATTFKTWKDEATDVYLKTNEVLKSVSGAFIVNHEIISDTIRRVTYDNGVVIIINYGKTVETVDGVMVGALSAVVEGR